MRYGIPSRPAHRAAAGGGSALLARGIGSPGLHRPPPALPRQRDRRSPTPHRPAPRKPIEPQRAVLWLTQGLAGVIMLGLALMIGFLVLASDRHQRASVTPSRPSTPAIGEVFGGDELRPAGATGAYRIEQRHSGTDCGEATIGGMTAVLLGHGCSAVVRAALTTPYPGGYRVTAGVFTLAGADGAAEVDELVRGLVETGDGGFTTLPVGGDPSTGQVGWHSQGNLLLYCVITRSDGALVTGDDPYAARITADLVDTHLGGSALGRRAAPPQPPGALTRS